MDILTADSGISGFDPAAIVIDSGLFAAQNPVSGVFSLSQESNSLVLNYSAAIPEPTGPSLLTLFAAGLLARRRR